MHKDAEIGKWSSFIRTSIYCIRMTWCTATDYFFYCRYTVAVGFGQLKVSYCIFAVGFGWLKFSRCESWRERDTKYIVAAGFGLVGWKLAAQKSIKRMWCDVMEITNDQTCQNSKNSSQKLAERAKPCPSLPLFSYSSLMTTHPCNLFHA